MNTVQQRQGNIAEEVRSIRDELRTIASSLPPGLDAAQRAVAEKKINDLEKRIDSLEAQKVRESRGNPHGSSAPDSAKIQKSEFCFVCPLW
jgi:hypothetical protein